MFDRHSPPLLFAVLISLGLNTVVAEVQSPEYMVDVWNIQDGLPHSTVTGITQTPDGYLWCSTHDGVVRFDGVRFVRIGPNDRAKMEANHVLSLFADHSGSLWIGTDGAGLVQYTNGVFKPVPGDSVWATNSIFTIVEDSNRDLWLGTRDGLARKHDEKISWLTIANGYSNAPNDARSLSFDQENNLWIADSVSLKTLRDGRFTTEFPRPENKMPRLWAVTHDRVGDAWAGSFDSKIWRLHEGKWSSIEGIGTLPYPDPVIFRQTASGDFWVGTRKGLYRCRNNQWKVFGTEDGMVSPDVRAIFEDREGNLWVGTSAGGLVRFKHRLVTAYTSKDGLTDGRVQALCEKPDGGLWVGLSRGGLSHGSEGKFSRCGTTRDLPSDSPVTSVLSARDGSLWVGTFGNQLWRFAGGATSMIDSNPGYRATTDTVTALLEDHLGDIWVGTYLGLRKVAGKKLAPVLVGERYYRAHVTALLEDHAGAKWIAFHGLGIVRMFRDQISWLTQREGLPSDFVRTLREDHSGTLWIGTAAGLSCWRDGKIRTLNKTHGLIDDVISQILEDDTGNLWLGSNQGVMQVARDNLEAVLQGRRTSLEVFVCGRGEGMLSLECSGGFGPAGLKTKDGRLWFPTGKGLVMVDPAELKRESNPLAPPVYIEEVFADGAVIASAALLNPNASKPPLGNAVYEVPAGTRKLEFKYTALSLTAPERVRFKHRLDGLDSDWIESGTARSIVYPKLAPGDYRFQVIACNNAGIWNESGASLALVVPPYFWQTWWFMGLEGLTGFTLVGAVVRFFEKKKVQRRFEQLEREQAIERERARIARDMHDEIGAKLTRISFQGATARRQLAHPVEIEQHLDKISQTARESISSLDQIVWAVDPGNDSLDSLANYICRHASEFFENSAISCQFVIPPKLPHCHLATDVRHNVFLAMKEAINNVLKYSGATQVEICLQVRANEFEILVSDNGRGFEQGDAAGGAPDRTRRAGHGLTNMRERLTVIGGRSEVKSVIGGGTRIQFIVPLEPRPE